MLAPRFRSDQATDSEASRTCASPLHSTGCCRFPGLRSPRSSSPPKGWWWGCGGARVVPAARAAGGPRVATTPRCAAGGIWIWGRASCCWKPRSAGWTADAAVGSAPRTWRGLVPGPGTPVTSRTPWRGLLNTLTRPPSPGCCGPRGRPPRASSNGSSPNRSTPAG